MLPVYFHSAQLEFHPKYEWAFGSRIKHPETTRRAESIYRELKKHKDLYNIKEPTKIPLRGIRDAHNYQLITLYNTAATLEDEHTFYPSVFPQRMKARPDPTTITNAGFYCFDSGTPLNNKTWIAAAWSAATAYYAADIIKKGNSQYAYALSRPPGHHASKDSYGGYCYFNNAAIAARHLKKKGRVAIVDIDFHHGNGTQDIFYKDNEVLVISIHGDPRDYFPYFCGFPSEVGSGKGEGFNLNIILDTGCTIKKYLPEIKKTVIPFVKSFEADYLIISAGFDTYKLDPIGKFALETEDYAKIAKEFKKLNLPTVILQEGGYFTKDLGKNAHSFLSVFSS